MSNCDVVYATVQDYLDFWRLGDEADLDQETTDQVQRQIDIVSSDIHEAMASAGRCDCPLASWAPAYLGKLTIIDLAVMFRPRCGPMLQPNEFEALLDWVTDKLDKIRVGETVLCEGETGKDVPAFAILEHPWTPDNQARQILRERNKNN